MATNKQLLNEIARFQAIAGLQPINSLNEDTYEEGMDMEESMDMEEGDMDMEEGMDMEEEGASLNEDLHAIMSAAADPDTWAVLKQLATLGGLTAGVGAAGKVLMMISKNKLKKEHPDWSEDQLAKAAKAELTAGAASSMGQSAGTGIGGGAAS